MTSNPIKPSRRALARFAGASALLTAAYFAMPAPAQAQTQAQAADTFPNRSLRLIVPFVPGGVTDTSGRLIAEQLSRRLGQQVIVENRPGASGNIGTAQVANAPADGYTLLLAYDGTMVINPHVFSNVGFDTVRDFAPIGKIGDAILLLVAHPSVPAKTLSEVIALSKSTTGGLSYGTSGTGGTPHIAAELLKQRTGANLTHIPYKGGGQAMADALGGNIPLVYTAVAGGAGHVKSGSLRGIAVSSAKRSSALPDVPTFIEAGISDFVVDSWVGLMVPAKTPTVVVAKLNAELNAVLSDPEVATRLQAMGIEASPGAPAVYGEQVKRDLNRYGSVVKAAGIKVE